MAERILAIDYGEKRIGLALSDPMQMFAKPYETIPNNGFDGIVSTLSGIIADKQVGIIIVGIPLSLEGYDTAKTKETREFHERLKELMPVQVIGVDERYTTSDANELLKEMGMNWKQARKVIDSMAACLILKRYLERNAR